MDFFKKRPNAQDLPYSMRPVGLRAAVPLDLAEVQRGQAATTGLFMSGVEQASLSEAANARLTDALKAEAAGDLLSAKQAYQSAQALQREAAMYASPVPKVEAITGPSDLLQWGTHGLGQGLRSTLPTVAASLGAGGAALLTRGRVPVGPAAFSGGAAAGYNQNADAFIGEAALDPEIRAMNTPEEIISSGRKYGLAAGAAEAIVPAMLARKLVGATPAGVMSAPKTIGMGMLTEGATETGQNLLQQQMQSNMVDDPGREFDWSQALNEGAIGALTGGSISAVGAGADAGWQYVNDAGRLAGEGANATAPYLQAGYERGKELAGAGYEKGKELAGKARDAAAPHLRDIKEGYDSAGVGGAAGVVESKIVEGAGYAADVIEGAVSDAYKKQFGTTIEDDVAHIGASTQDMSDQELIRFANVNKAKAPSLARAILDSEKARGHLTDADRELLERISLGKGSDVENRRVANVYKTIRDNNELEGKITDILQNGDVRDPKSRASRQLTEDDISRRDNVRALLASYGIDTLTQNKLSDLAAKGDNKLFDAAVKRELVAKGKIDHVENAVETLRAIGFADEAVAPAPKNRKERRKVQTLNNIREAAARGMKMSDLWSRINGYVANAVKGTKYDTRDTKAMLTNQLGGLLEQVANGKQDQGQILRLRALLGEAIGEAAVEMVDIISDMAEAYQKWTGRGGDADAKIADLKNSIKGREKAALFAIDEMLHGKGSTEKAGDRRAASTKVLRQLTNAYMAATKQTQEVRLERMQSAYAQAERMRQEGDFQGARRLEDKADAEFEKDPMAGYEAAVSQHFGKGKVDRVTAVVREYLGEVNEAATDKKNGLGYAKSRAGDGRKEGPTDLDDFEGQQAAAELAGSEPNDNDSVEIVTKAQNETGLHNTVSDVDYMVFGANGATADGEFSGGAVSVRKRFDSHKRTDGLDSPVAILKAEVEALNQGGRVKVMSPIKWADSAAKRDGTDADIMLTDMAKGQMEVDAKRKDALRRKMRDASDSERELIGKELDEIADREGLYKNVNGNGREFYASRINGHLRVVATAPATAGNIEVDADLVQRFRVGDEDYSAQKWAERTGGNKQDFLNSILSVTNDEGTVIKIDFAGMVAEMMQRNQPGDIAGLGEKNIDPSLIVDLRSAILNIATSMMFGDAVQHVDGNPFGEAFAQMSDYTFHPDKFGKKKIDPKKVNWGFDPTKVAYRSPDSGLTLTFGQVFGASGPSAASSVHTNAMSSPLSDKELGVVVGKKSRSGTIFDGEGNLYEFNPRELLKVMMTRHDMRAEDIMPAGQESSGLSTELTGQLIFEGLLLLEKQGFSISGVEGLVSSSPEVNARQNALVINTKAEGVEGDNGSAFNIEMKYGDIRGTVDALRLKFAEKRKLNPKASAIGLYGGAYDYRSDKQLALQADLEKKMNEAADVTAGYKAGKKPLDDVLDAVMALEQAMKFGDDAVTTKKLKGVNTPPGTSAGRRSVSIKEDGQKITRTNDTLSRLDENSHDNTEPLFTDPANQFGGGGFNSDKAKAPQSTVGRTATGNNLDRDTLVKGKRKEWRDSRAAELRAERSEKRAGSSEATVTPVNLRTPNDYAGPAPTPTMTSTVTAVAQPLTAVDQAKTRIAKAKAERDAKAAQLRAERAAKRAERNAPATAPETTPTSEPIGTSAEDLLDEVMKLPQNTQLIVAVGNIAKRGGMPSAREFAAAIVANLKAAGKETSPDHWPVQAKRMYARLLRNDGPDGGGGGGSRASRQSTEIHNSLGKSGFAATHDSPIRHDGKFNWREHGGKGEGNAAFGAGTYLSTADGVHRSYKNQFTAAIKPEFNYQAAERLAKQISAQADVRINAYASEAGKIGINDGKRAAIEYLETVKSDSEDNHVSFMKAPEAYGYDSNDTKKMDHIVSEHNKWMKIFDKLILAVKSLPESDFTAKKNEGFKADTSPTYHVTVNIKPEELLDWNAPFSEQSQFVQSALKTALANTSNEKVRDALDLLVNGMGRIHPDAGQTYSTLSLVLSSQAKASDYLQSLGILGHKYAASSGREDTHPNYVIYDDSKIETNYVHFSRQGQNSQQQAPTGNATGNTKDVAVAAALADAERRLKDAVDAVVADVVLDDDGNRVSGLYTPKSKTTKALMQVARDVLSLRGSMAHENWHAVEDLLLELGPKGKHIVDTIHAAASKPESVDWIMDHLIERGEDPTKSAALDQLADPSERAAFMFQFFIETGGKMPIPIKARGFFAKIKNLLKKMVGIQDDLIKAGAFFAYFDKGTFANEMHDAEKVLAGLGETTREKYAAKVAAAAEPLRKMANAVFGHAADRIRELNIPEYTEILEKFQTGQGKSAGFMREHNARSYEFFNKFSRIVAGKDKLSDADKGKIAALVAEVETYKEKAGAQFDKRRTEIPPSLDPAKIEGSLDDFIHTLLAYGGFPKGTKRADVERIANEILMRGFHTQGRHNVLEMYPEKFKKWLSDDPTKDAFVYVKKSTYEAEMARAFSDKSLEKLLAAGDEKADASGREMIRTYINAAQGKAHLSLSPELRKLFGAITTGVNLSILPFAVFSQMIEPLQLAFRKNDLSSAMDSAFRGFRDLPRTFKSVDSGAVKDKWENIAADMGIIAEAQAVTMMADIMNEVPMTGKLGKVNDLFFRYNGMEQWSRSMFVAATKNGLEMIKEHDKTKSEVGDQLLEELGLTRGEIPYKDGEVDYNNAKIRTAVLRFVNESMAHPDAGTNTIWMNDARFALFAHLKRFTFAHAYHVNERIINKLDKGDLRSLVPVALMVPWMIAVDTMKDVVKPGDEAYKDAWGVSDYVAHGIERSSLYGRYDIGLGAVENIERGGSGIETASTAGEMASKVARGFGDGRGGDAVKEALPVVGW